MSAAVVLRSRTFRSLRRHHNYRLFFAGQVVSLAGSWMQNVALAWLVLQLSRSPLAVAALIFCRFAPYTLLGIPAGAIVDRLDTRRLVMWTQAAAMLVSIALAVVALTGTASLPIVYLLAALGGVTLVLDAPGRQTLTFEMVGPRELPNAVALNSGLLNASRVIGPGDRRRDDRDGRHRRVLRDQRRQLPRGAHRPGADAHRRAAPGGEGAGRDRPPGAPARASALRRRLPRSAQCSSSSR